MTSAWIPPTGTLKTFLQYARNCSRGKFKGVRNSGYALVERLACAVFHVFSHVLECRRRGFHSCANCCFCSCCCFFVFFFCFFFYVFVIFYCCVVSEPGQQKHHAMGQLARVDNLTICYCEKQFTRLSCYWLLVYWSTHLSPRGSTPTSDNVTTKFMINNSTDAWSD